jgi:lipopolysaccharide/colanic/teichoic acid biosynthesis glycosyltransferase
MGMCALIVDRPLPCGAARQRGGASALLAPTPRGAVAVTVLDQLRACDIVDVFVCPPVGAEAGYSDVIHERAPGVGLLSIAEFGRRVAGAEPTDAWLIVDAWHVAPHENIYRLLANGAARQPGAAHLIALAAPQSGARECVVLDERGAVARFERVFPGVTHFRTPTVAATRASVAALRSVGPAAFDDLPGLRTALAGAGVPSQDISLAGSCVDLSARDGLIELCEHLGAARRAAPLDPEWLTDAADVWKSPRASIHPASRVVGPVTVLDGASVAAGALIVGPAVIGPGARVESGGIVSRAVVLDRAVVKAGRRVVGEVFGGGPEAQSGSRAGGRPRSRARQLSSAASVQRSHVGWAARGVKRGADIVFSALGLLVLAPLLALVALLIKLTSRGPVFFAHEREGRGGRVFHCLKFRTMVHRAHGMQRRLYDVNNVDGPQFKLDNDPRVTRLGHFLRRSNIDELPQLFNVLLGDMSLIGPRPSPFRENQICMPWRATRLAVRPGVTGLWQICRSDREFGDFHQWIHYDIQYVQNQSLWLDVKILLATALTAGGRWSVPDRWLLGSAAAINRTPRAKPRLAFQRGATPGALRPATVSDGAVAWAAGSRDSRHAAG